MTGSRSQMEEPRWHEPSVSPKDRDMADHARSHECPEVVGSSPTPGANKLDTNSFFEDESVRSPSPAIGGAGLRSATATPLLWREMKRILMLSGDSIFSFFKI